MVGQTEGADRYSEVKNSKIIHIITIPLVSCSALVAWQKIAKITEFCMVSGNDVCKDEHQSLLLMSSDMKSAISKRIGSHSFPPSIATCGLSLAQPHLTATSLQLCIVKRTPIRTDIDYLPTADCFETQRSMWALDRLEYEHGML